MDWPGVGIRQWAVDNKRNFYRNFMNIIIYKFDSCSCSQDY